MKHSGDAKYAIRFPVSCFAIIIGCFLFFWFLYKDCRNIQCNRCKISCKLPTLIIICLILGILITIGLIWILAILGWSILSSIVSIFSLNLKEAREGSHFFILMLLLLLLFCSLVQQRTDFPLLSILWNLPFYISEIINGTPS